MTAQTNAVLKSSFEQGDKPQGSDFADLIDSFLSVVDTTAQEMLSDLTVPNLTVTEGLIVASLTVQDLIASSLVVLSPVSFTGAVSAPILITQTLNCGGSAQTSVLNVAATAQVYWCKVSNRIQWGSVAGCELSVNGTVNAVGFRFLDSPIIGFTSAETSAFFGDSGVTDMGAVKFTRIVVNGSVYAIPLFRGSLVP